MASDHPRKQVLSLLIGLISVAVGAGVTFAHGFDHWLRSDPAYWTHVSVLAMFCALLARGKTSEGAGGGRKLE
jgi:hypothetical protein